MCSVFGSTAEFSTKNTPGVFFVRKHSRIHYKEQRTHQVCSLLGSNAEFITKNPPVSC